MMTYLGTRRLTAAMVPESGSLVPLGDELVEPAALRDGLFDDGAAAPAVASEGETMLNNFKDL